MTAAMSNIESAMHQNVAGTSQPEAAGRKLEGLGNTLQDLISRYRI